MTTTVLPDNILRRMSTEDRKTLGKAGLTASECRKIIMEKSEKDLQKIIAQWLRLRGLYYDMDAMHKKRAGTIGAPDFQFPYRGKFVAWEVKFGKNSLSLEQSSVRDSILKQGGEWRLIKSLEEAKNHLNELDKL
jgi:hypothetical protein